MITKTLRFLYIVGKSSIEIPDLLIYFIEHNNFDFFTIKID